VTPHLIAATITGLIASAIALVLRRSSAGLRHAVLLAGLLGFAAPTPWLNRAGYRLACLVLPPSAPSLLGLESFLARVPLPATAVALPSVSRASGNVLWLLWAAVFGLSLAAYLRRLLRTVPAVRQANSAEVKALAGAAASLGLARSVTLCIASADRVPGARGWRRPCVILPDLLSDHLSEGEFQAIVAHELAHISRRDNLSAAIARVIVSAFWFHPLVWWMERRMLAEREAACDERVLAHGADPADYVSAILKVCHMSFAGTAGLPVSHGYAGATGSDLKHRMEQIMSTRALRPPSLWLRTVPVALVFLASILPVGEGFLRGQTPALQTPDPTITHTHSGNDAAVQQAYECWKQGRFQEAEILYRQIYVADPEDPRGAVGLAETYVSESRPADAIELMRTEAAKHPDRTDLRVALGNLYARTEQYDLAISELQGALDAAKNLSPEEKTQLLFRLGETNRRKGDLNEAVRLFGAASAANPKDSAAVVQALLPIALILDGTGRSDQAAPVYEQILKLQPNQPVALNNLAYIVAQVGSDPDRALSLARQAAQALKDSPDIQDTLGWAYLKKNQSDDAIAAFRAALQSEPDNSTYHYHLGMALVQVGQREAAIHEWQTALAGHPSPQDAERIRDLLQKIAP
jgi:beta-lactamase regulating signal transducer with metallopeptidase domain/Flp pilus assembly protein TadD